MRHRMIATLCVYGPDARGVTIRLPVSVYLTTNEEDYQKVADRAHEMHGGAVLFDSSFPGGGVKRPANAGRGYFVCIPALEVPDGSVQLEALDWPPVSP